MTLNGRLSLNLNVNYQSALDNQNVNADLARTIAIALANGTGSGQADKLFSDTRALSSGGSDNLDLAGSLTDAFGATLTFVTIKAIIIESDEANTVNLTVGGGSNPFINWVGDATDVVVIKPGGLFVLVAPQTGYAVTASTGDILKILAGAAAVSYRIHIIGTSA